MAKSREQKPNTESVDDYLKAIFHLGHGLAGQGERVGSGERVSSGDLAEQLGVAPASVTNMVQKLASLTPPLVEYERHYGVSLSPAGRRRALEIVRHHRLIETFLFRVLDYPVEAIHDEAERLEHFISEDFERAVAKKLGDPEVDPHGRCIPRMDGSMPEGHGVSCSCR
jgi:DtxR family transcriptional regulator, Mn-dependent transcriptional regulator